MSLVFKRPDGTFGEFEPVDFPRVESQPDQPQRTLPELERDLIAGAAGREIVAAMLEWQARVPQGVRDPKEQI